MLVTLGALRVEGPWKSYFQFDSDFVLNSPENDRNSSV